MTKDEIEKLADEYVVSNMKSFMEENLTYTDVFKAGYLKGVESLRKENEKLRKQLEIAKEALEFSSNGCLVPPDGGSPDVYSHINNAKQALEQIEQLLSSAGEK